MKMDSSHLGGILLQPGRRDDDYLVEEIFLHVYGFCQAVQPTQGWYFYHGFVKKMQST